MTLYYDDNRTGNFEIYQSSADGSNERKLTSDPAFDSWWPKIKPDHTQILFCRTPRGAHDNDITAISLWTMGPLGTDLVRRVGLPSSLGFVEYAHPEWSPNGAEVTIAGNDGLNDYIKVLSAVTWGVTKTPVVIPRTAGNAYDPSYAPGGNALLFVLGLWGSNLLASVPDMDAGEVTGLLNLGKALPFDPYYSPDGMKIAYIQFNGGMNVSLRTCDWNGANNTNIINDGNTNSKPCWYDDNLIYFHRRRGTDPTFGVWRIRRDGKRLTRIRPLGEYPDIRKTG